jgi:HEAT repeat protein
MSLFDNLSDRLRRRSLDGAFRRGDDKRLVEAALSERRPIRQHAAELITRAGYERVGHAIRDACVDLCRQRTELWREKMPDSTIEMVVKQKLDIQVYIDKFIASKKERSGRIDSRIDFLSAVAVRLGEPMVDMLLSKYAEIAKQNGEASRAHYKNRKEKDYSTYDPPIEPWLGFESIGDIAQDDISILHKLAALYSEQHCSDAVRGLRYTHTIDEQIWDALSSSAKGGALWSIQAVGKSGDKRSLDVFEVALQSYLTEGAAVQLAEALGRCGGERAGKLLEDLFKKNTDNWGDNFIQAVCDAIADLGHKPAIPLLMQELSKLEGYYGKYPDSIVKDKPKHGYRSSWEPGNRSVGHLTLALGRLGVPEVKDRIKRILKNPIDTVYEEVDRFSTDYLLRRSSYDPYGMSDTRTTWTITYSPWVLYQATLAAGAYEDFDFVGVLRSLLRHDKAIVRYGAITALSKFVPSGYRDGFGSCLSDNDSLVREAGVRAQGKALAGVTEERTIIPVIELMGDADDGVRASARGAVVAIGSGAVPVLKKYANSSNLRVRVGVLSCLAELADVRDAPKSMALSSDGATVFVTPEVALTGDHEDALRMLREAWNANVAAQDLKQRVHLEFPVPREGEDGVWERDAVRRWVADLESKLPQAPCILSDQSLAAWLRLRLPQRRQDIRESQATGEYGGGASRAALLMELIDRAHESAVQVGGGNLRKQQNIEKILVDRLVSHLQ